jgi:hypothetical protein
MSSSIKSNQTSSNLKRPRSVQQLNTSKINSSVINNNNNNNNNNTNVLPGANKKLTTTPSSNRNTLHYATLTKSITIASLTSDNATNQPPPPVAKNSNMQQPKSRALAPKTAPKSSSSKVSSLTMHPRQLRQQ